MLAIQYLEDSPDLARFDAQAVRQKLRQAGEILPLSEVCIGWQLPPALLEVCIDETRRMGARLFRWHPLLTSDGSLITRREWQTIGLNGQAVTGFQDMPEFTFACPNQPEVRSAVLARLEAVLADGVYDGLFLDRIRFPSPAVNPDTALACFCRHCREEAGRTGLDLEKIGWTLEEWLQNPVGRQSLATGLLTPANLEDTPGGQALRSFLRFRSSSITCFVASCADLVRMYGGRVGLDAFSPALTAMVGQDLAELGRHADWVKVMSYAHAYGPAGLPFELLGLADWLASRGGMAETEALALLGRAAGLDMPPTRASLRRDGLSSTALGEEVRRGAVQTPCALLAGLEVVEIEGVAELNEARFTSDLLAVQAAQPVGLALSWDLWHMPLARLKTVRRLWYDKE